MRSTVTDVIYTPDTTLPRAWVFDMDGTLALMHDRTPFEYEKALKDHRNHPVARIAGALRTAGDKIVVMTGRDAMWRSDAIYWLSLHDVKHDELIMRPEGDRRRDSIVKLELFWEHVAPRYNVQGTFEDRTRVVEMWRSIGLMCAQIAPGDF